MKEINEGTRDGRHWTEILFPIILMVGFIFAGIGALFFSQMFMFFIINLVLNIVFGILAVLFISKTNCWSEFKSSLRGTPILKVYRRDRTVQNITCKIKAGMAETADEGKFIITPDSVYRDKKTNLPVLAAFADYGVTIHPKMAMVATKLKKEKIKDIAEAEVMNADLMKSGHQIAIPIPDHETIKFDDIRGFFKYNVSPHYIAAAVERRVVLGLAGVRDMSSILKWAMIMVVIIIGGLGSMKGAFLGSLIVGFLDNFGKALFP
jgi:hypothetical protein